MCKLSFQICYMVFILLISSCCDKSENIETISFKYPNLKGAKYEYIAIFVRTNRNDLSEVIDTIQTQFQNSNGVFELGYNFSKETLPEDPLNQPNFIVIIQIRATSDNGLTKDSVIFQDSISNFKYEFEHCKLEHFSYEFNGVETNSREIIIVD